MTVQKRGCMKVNQTQGKVINHCKPIDSDDEDERTFVGTVLSVLPETATNMTLDKIDGKLCVCGTDLCDANCKGVAIFPFWYVLQYDVLSDCSFKIKDYIRCSGYTWRGSRRENNY